MATVKERMLEAQQLIKAKDYEGARAILKKVKHPKAAEWLTRLDELAPIKPARRWWLWALVAVVLLLVVGGGVVAVTQMNGSSERARLEVKLVTLCVKADGANCAAWAAGVMASHSEAVKECDRIAGGSDDAFIWDCLNRKGISL